MTYWQQKVSIHAPARGATAAPDPRPYLYPVSIHAPARGATPANQAVALSPVMFQSTHPHGVRPFNAYRSRFMTHVSIHAPARGATGHSRKSDIF